MFHPPIPFAMLLAATVGTAQELPLPKLLQLGPLPAAATPTLRLAPGVPSVDAAVVR